MNSVCLGTSGTADGSGGDGSDPPKYPKMLKEHEVDVDYDDSKVLANCSDDDSRIIDQIYLRRLLFFQVWVPLTREIIPLFTSD